MTSADASVRTAAADDATAVDAPPGDEVHA